MYLHEMLKQVIKETQFQFYLEHASHLNQDVLQQRKQQLKEADIVLVVVSPKFAESKASHILIEHYLENLRKKQVNPQHKIFKIVKLPIQQKALPEPLQLLIDQPFYIIDKESGQAEEIDDHFGKEAKSAFWLPLTDLCFEIKKYLENAVELAHKKEKYVFLAKTGTDLELERAVIKRELERRDYKVLPNANFPTQTAQLEQVILSDLSKSLLSIHMVGNQAGEKLEQSEESYLEIQNRIAAKYSENLNGSGRFFPRLIWIASEEKHIEEKQKFYIDHLKRDKSLQLGADILETQLEDFKSAVLNYLAEQLNDQSFKKDLDSEKKGKSIYLISDKRDIDYAQNLAHVLANIGFEVMISSFDRKKANSRRTHQELLNKCDVACVLFFDAKQEWLTAKLQDIVKSAGMGRKRPFEQKLIVTNKSEISDFLEKLTFLKSFSSTYHVIESEWHDDFKEVGNFFLKADSDNL